MIRLIKQMIRFGIVGVFSTGLDMGLLYLFTEFFHIHYFLSAALSFSVSVIFNYSCSMAFVFTRAEGTHQGKEFFVFIFLCICGLLINQLLMWLLVEKLHIYYMVSKIFATAVVMVWNFVTRKIFIEKKPEGEETGV